MFSDQSEIAYVSDKMINKTFLYSWQIKSHFKIIYGLKLKWIKIFKNNYECIIIKILYMGGYESILKNKFMVLSSYIREKINETENKSMLNIHIYTHNIKNQ